MDLDGQSNLPKFVQINWCGDGVPVARKGLFHTHSSAVADFLRGDIVLLEVSMGRYWDESSNGKVLNWNSNRVYFHLESVSLILAGNDEADEAQAGKEAGR